MATSITLAEIYADRLHRALLDRPVLTLEDLYKCPAVAGFSRVTVEKLVGLLVGDGRLTDDGYGRLHVTSLEEGA